MNGLPGHREGWRARLHRLLIAGACAGLCWCAGAHAAADLQAGAQLYREGRQSDGTLLTGVRADGSVLTGRAAACVNCHRRSGLGVQEGQVMIPPVTGAFLTQPRNITGRASAGQPGPASVLTFRPAFDAVLLARAVREGRSSDGNPLSLLMPRYALDAQQMDNLQAYLLQLGSGRPDGVDEDTLQFATVVTPDADPVARDAMLATLETFFSDRNHIIAGQARPILNNARGVMYRVTRRWNLQVWTLRGPAETWTDQLRQYQQARPVFALVSGLGAATWSPVHAFCEAVQVPCLFPNVDAPRVQPDDFYARYFSRGVYLEADLMLARLASLPLPAPARLVIVARGGLAGQGAHSLQAAAEAAGWSVVLRMLPEQHDEATSTAALAAAVAVPPGTALALWLPPEDLAHLPGPGSDVDGSTDSGNAAAGAVLVSGLLGGLDDMPLPEGWRARARITYPFELPAQRTVAMQYPQSWFRIRQLALTAPRVQYQTYLACQILSEVVGELHVNLVPDYLLERLEVMLSHRQLTGLYPRLSLGVGQSFASKGGYLARFSAARQLVADDGWQVP